MTTTAAILGLQSDPDLWGHLRFGFDFLDTLRVPSRDVYSFTGDRVWINHEWLFELLVALVQRSGGWGGIRLLVLAIAAATAIALAVRMQRRNSPGLENLPPPEAKVLPSGLKATELTPPSCPLRVALASPVAASHTRTVLSLQPRRTGPASRRAPCSPLPSPDPRAG